MRFPKDLFVLKKQRKNFAANQKRLNLPPFFKVLVTAFVKESSAVFAWVFVIPASSAITSIKSALFIIVGFYE